LHEESTFEHRFADYTEAIAACQEAIRLLLQLGNRQPGAVFLQMNQNFGKVKEQLEKHAQSAESAFVQPILDVLSQLANGAQYDYSTITNIVDLIRSLLKNLQAAQQELESNHGKVEQDLQTLISNLANQLENIKVNVDIYDTRLSEIEVRMNELQPLVNQYETLAEVNSKMLEATIASCKDNDQLHAQAQAARAKQLEVVNALSTYFVSEAKGRN
jgi:DNA repair exonuclease SbcCD ATPase subunit